MENIRFPIILYVQAFYGRQWLTITLAATAWEYSLSAVMLYGKSTQDQSPNFWFIQCDSEKVWFLNHDYTDRKNRYPAMMKTVVFNDHHHIQKKTRRKNSRENPATSRTQTISPHSGKATIGIHVFHEIQRWCVFFFGFWQGISPTIKVSNLSYPTESSGVSEGLSFSLMTSPLTIVKEALQAVPPPFANLNVSFKNHRILWGKCWDSLPTQQKQRREWSLFITWWRSQDMKNLWNIPPKRSTELRV